LGQRDRVLAALIEAGEEGVPYLALQFKGGDGDLDAHIASLRNDGYPSIKEEPHDCDLAEEWARKFVLAPRAVEAAKCCMDIEALRLRLVEEQQADPDPTTGYDDENKERLHRAMTRSISGSVQVRHIVRHYAFSYEELVEYPEHEPVKGMLGAAYPAESLGRAIAAVEAAEE
jgi:hypothetical protein